MITSKTSLYKLDKELRTVPLNHLLQTTPYLYKLPYTVTNYYIPHTTNYCIPHTLPTIQIVVSSYYMWCTRTPQDVKELYVVLYSIA